MDGADDRDRGELRKLAAAGLTALARLVFGIGRIRLRPAMARQMRRRERLRSRTGQAPSGRPVHDKHSCDCGAAVENMAHVHLHCPLYGKFRAPFALLLDEFADLANRTQGPFGLPGIAGREEALYWIHHDQPALLVDTAKQSKGEELRSAALAFYSQIQHERHVTGRSTRRPNPQPEYLVEPEHADLLAHFATPTPL